MSKSLRILLVIVALLLLIVLLSLVSRKKIPIKYSLFWIVSSIIVFLVGATPKFFLFFTKITGFKTISNLVIGVILTILLVITLLLTIIVSEQKRKIILLVQEVSTLKEKIK